MELRTSADELLALVANLRYRASQDSSSSSSISSDSSKMLKAASMLRLQVVRLLDHVEAAADPKVLQRLRHDARTPINQLLGYCELVAEEAADEGDERWGRPLSEIEVLVRAMLAQIDALGPRRSTGELDVPIQLAAAAAASSRAVALDGTVLVVDDNRSNREMLERRLERYGLRVLTATHGGEALAACAEHEVDTVLLDIMMPVMDGFEALRRIKRDPELRHLPVIMLSSLDDPQSITRCIQQGADDHLPKPFDPVLLRARIESCLERKRVRDREREYLARIVAEKRRADDLLHGVIPLGVALGAERDMDRLLRRFLTEARHFCGADGGVISLRNEGGLEHMQMQCDSLGLTLADLADKQMDAPGRESGGAGDGTRPLAPAMVAVVEDRVVNLVDLDAAAGEYDLRFVRAFERRFSYGIRSLLALPVRDGTGEVVGALVLWNATAAEGGQVVPFSPGAIEILGSMSLLAGAALKSYRRETELRRRIRHLEIRVDEANRRREVSQITDTDYFRNLRDMAQRLRAAAKGD